MQEAGLYSRGSWILRDSSGVPQMVRRMNNEIPVDGRARVRLQTFDFAKMYTNIRLDVLKARMRVLFTQLFDHQSQSGRRRNFLRVPSRRGEATWVAKRGAGDNEHVKFFHDGQIVRVVRASC